MSDIARWEDDGGYTVPTPALRKLPPRYWFDETPAKTALDRLRQLPSLVHQVILTLDAPNPGGEPGRATRTTGSRPPGSLHPLDLLRTTDHRAEEYSTAPLIRLAECSRLVWEAFDAETRAVHPQPGGLSWRTECAWLAESWPDAQAFLDLSDFDWIETEIRTIHSMFRAAAKLPRTVRYACPKCRGTLEPAPGSWLKCADCPHEEPADVERKYRRQPPRTISSLAEEFGVAESTIRSWQRRGKLAPARIEKGRPLFFPWDVLLLARPAVAQALADKERMGA